MLLSTSSPGSLFHSSITLWLRKYFLESVLKGNLYNFWLLPLVSVLDFLKNLFTSTLSIPLIILNVSIRSPLSRRFAEKMNLRDLVFPHTYDYED